MRIRLLALVAALALASPSAAHHGWGEYEDAEFSLTGVVDTANLGGPHGLLRVRASGGTWDVVLAPPTRISRRPHPGSGAARHPRRRARPSPPQPSAHGNEDRATGGREPHLRSLSRTQLSGLESFAAWLEATPLARFLQDWGWIYAGVNTAHVLGIALLVGAIVVLDLRLLGLWRSVPVASLARPTVTVAATGLVLALTTGPMLLMVQATEYVANPFLYVKFGAILVGLLNLGLLRLAGDWTDDGLTRRRRLAGLMSLLAWLTALTAGRMIAYW